MKTLMRTLATAGLALLFAANCLAGQLWFEDNNTGVAAGTPNDFAAKFADPQSWANARKYINVYMVRANVLITREQEFSDEFLSRQFLPVLRSSGIRLALDAGGATWLGTGGKREEMLNGEMRLIQRIKRLGGQVSYVALQSVLSKPRRDADKQERDYPMQQRVADVVRYATALRQVDPSIEVGIMDALPSHGKDYASAYAALREAMAARGLKLAFVHLDTNYELILNNRNGMSWQKVREVQGFVQNRLGAKFGLFFTSRRGGVTSDTSFHDAVVSMANDYLRQGGAVDQIILASWFPHPARTIPEDARGMEPTNMSTVLDVGRRLAGERAADVPWQPAPERRRGERISRCRAFAHRRRPAGRALDTESAYA